MSVNYRIYIVNYKKCIYIYIYIYIYSRSLRTLVLLTADWYYKDIYNIVEHKVCSVKVCHYITSVVKPVHFVMARNRVSKSCLKGWALFPSLCAFCLCSKIYIYIYIYIYMHQNIKKQLIIQKLLLTSWYIYIYIIQLKPG